MTDRAEALDDFHRARLKAADLILRAGPGTSIPELHERLNQQLSVMATAQPFMTSKEPSK